MLPCPPQNQSNSSERMNSRLGASNTSGSCPPKPPNGNWSTLTTSAVCPTRSSSMRNIAWSGAWQGKGNPASRTVTSSNRTTPDGQSRTSAGRGRSDRNRDIQVAVCSDAITRGGAAASSSNSRRDPPTWSAWKCEYTTAVTGSDVTEAIAARVASAPPRKGSNSSTPRFPT